MRKDRARWVIYRPSQIKSLSPPFETGPGALVLFRHSTIGHHGNSSRSIALHLVHLSKACFPFAIGEVGALRRDVTC